nr:TetR/AcrR family transcriptional regulator [Shewanella jiangmenensis]
MTALRCNQILDAAAVLVEQQGIVSFKFSQLAKEVGCSTGTLYRFFQGKEDILVCLFLRHATSNYLAAFVRRHPELTAQQRLLLPVIFTFETIRRSKVFFTLRSVSVNKLVWQLASEEKVGKFKRRINAFWSWFHRSIDLAIASGELSAGDRERSELTQSLVFFLTGVLTQFESELIPVEFLGERRETCYRHLALLMSRYGWQQPLTQARYTELEAQVARFFDAEVKSQGNCDSCAALDSQLQQDCCSFKAH